MVAVEYVLNVGGNGRVTKVKINNKERYCAVRVRARRRCLE